jgi:methionine-rich copper-binding protein CopC
VVALVGAAVVMALVPASAAAHTELEFSLPGNGTTVGEPVEEIRVGFTDIVALVGNGFTVHDPQGNVLTPFVVTDDNKAFRFQLDPPLAGGVVVVDYHVRALDGDEQQGSFSFVVAVPALPSSTSTTTSTTTTPTSTSTTTTSTTLAPGTTAPAPTTDPAGVTTAPPEASGTTVPSTLPAGNANDDQERTLFVVLLGIAAVAAAFLLVRSRRTA